MDTMTPPAPPAPVVAAKKRRSIGRTITLIGIGVFIVGALLTALGSSSNSAQLPAGVTRNPGWTDAQLTSSYTRWQQVDAGDSKALCVFNALTGQVTYTQFQAMSSAQYDALGAQVLSECP